MPDYKPDYNNFYRGVYNASMGLTQPPETPEQEKIRKNQEARKVAENLVKRYKLPNRKATSKGGSLRKNRKSRKFRKSRK